LASKLTPRPASSIFHAVTHVWGRSYLDLFLNVCIPNQLAPGNIPALPAGSRYRILTRAIHQQEIDAHPQVRALRDVIPVDIVPIDSLEKGLSVDGGYELMIACHQLAVADSLQADAAILFLSADLVLSSQAIAAVVARHRQGFRAVVTTGLRLNRESFVARLSEPDVQIGALSPRELVAMALPHLHQHTLSMFADADPFNRFPVAVYWRAGSEGLVARGLHLHPLLVDPQDRRLPVGTVDGAYLSQAVPDRSLVHVVTDSDEFQMFELTQSEREVLPAEGAGASMWRSLLVAATCDDLQRAFWRDYAILIHSRGVEGPQWQLAQRAAASYVARVTRLEPHRRTIYKWSKRYGLLCKRRDQLVTHAQRAARQVARNVARSQKRLSRAARVLEKRLRKLRYARRFRNLNRW
jgi:hypothetical protein